MALVMTPGEEGHGIVADSLKRNGKPCYYCFKQLKYPMVVWIGSTAEIGLHYVCARLWAAHLLTDVAQIQARNQLRYQTIRERRTA